MLFSLIISLISFYLLQCEAYISSNPYNNYDGKSYSYQQNYALSQPYGYSSYYSNPPQYNYNPYSHLYIGNYPIARPNQGMLPGGYVEPGNIGWGNNVASAFLFCMSCSSRG